MPRKFFKKLSPDPHQIRKNRIINLFGELLHDPNLWHLNRRSVAGALGIGFFFMWMPVPVQMYLAAATAIWLRVNLPLSVATVWITNPLTMGPMFFFAYKVGTWLIGAPTLDFTFHPTLDWLLSLGPIWKPFIVGCLFLGIGSGLIAYFGIHWLWTWSVLRQRSENRRNRQKP